MVFVSLPVDKRCTLYIHVALSYSKMPGKRILALEFSNFSRGAAPPPRPPPSSALAIGGCGPAVCALFQRLHRRSRNPGSAPEIQHRHITHQGTAGNYTIRTGS
jgi:hypothetical protein